MVSEWNTAQEREKASVFGRRVKETLPKANDGVRKALVREKMEKTGNSARESVTMVTPREMAKEIHARAMAARVRPVREREMMRELGKAVRTTMETTQRPQTQNYLLVGLVCQPK